MKLHIQKNIDTIINTTHKISPKVINLSNIFSTKYEIEILKLGLSFTSTPKHNNSELETDIYNFIRKTMLDLPFP